MYARNAAKMLLDHFVSKMVRYARTHTRVDETAQNPPPQPVAALDLGVRGRKPKRRRVWVDDRAWIGLD